MTTLVLADEEVDITVSNYSAEEITTQSNAPFFFESKADFIEKTKIKKGFFEDDHVQFATGEAQLGMFFYGCPRYKEGAYAAIKYITTFLHWPHNPWFEQSHFHTASFSLGGVTQRINRWLWKAEAAINMDANEWDINDYANYDLLLWGRYEYAPDIGVHVGLIVQTGMQMDRVYPILGFDWRISKKLKLNLVFPVNVSLEYMITQNWSILMAGRNFDSRFRVSHNKGHRKPLLRYSNVGGEIVIKYENTAFSFNVHAGSTLGGLLRVANHSNHHPRHFHLKPSPYAGGEVAVKF